MFNNQRHLQLVRVMSTFTIQAYGTLTASNMKLLNEVEAVVLDLLSIGYSEIVGVHTSIIDDNWRMGHGSLQQRDIHLQTGLPADGLSHECGRR